MKVLEIWAENVRGISSRKTIKPSASGVTLIHAPNESGKTTLSEVLTFLFSYPNGSKDSVIKSLQPIGKDVGPAMGATFVIGGDTYVVTKQWLKDKKTEVVITGTRNEQLAGPDAQREIDRVFSETLDSTFWDLLQLQQAEFNSLIDDQFDKDFLEDLQNLLDRISTDSDEENADTLFEAVEKEYFKWFTATGRPTTVAGSEGKELSEVESELVSLKREEIGFTEKIDASARIQEAIKHSEADVDFLTAAYKAQQLEKEINPLRISIGEFDRLEKKIHETYEANPTLSDFSSEKFLELSGLYPLELKYGALASIELKALANTSVQIQGQDVALGIGDARTVPLEPGLQIVLPGILEISYGESSSESPNLVEAHDRFIQLLSDLNVKDWSEAEKLNRVYESLKADESKLKTLTKDGAIEADRVKLKSLQEDVSKYANWDELLAFRPVGYEELEKLTHAKGLNEGQWLEINKNGWEEKLNNTRSQIQSLESRKKRLSLRRDAIRKLYIKLSTNRENSARVVAPLFAEKLNEVAKAFFGAEVDFHVTNEFVIQSRYKDGTSVPISLLSTGAKEQLAILIRLTLSRLVQTGNEINEGVPVIFDDEFGHTDPTRLNAMASLFKNLGNDQQFIFMTCYPDKFDDFEITKKIDLLA